MFNQTDCLSLLKLKLYCLCVEIVIESPTIMNYPFLPLQKRADVESGVGTIFQFQLPPIELVSTIIPPMHPGFVAL